MNSKAKFPTPSFVAQVQESALHALNKQFEVLRHNPRRYFELKRLAAEEVKKNSARRIRSQESLEGGGFEPRSKHRSRYRKQEDGSYKQKRKMLTTLGKTLAHYREGEDVLVSWKRAAFKSGKKTRESSAHYANIAYPHQHGSETKMTSTEVNSGTASFRKRIAQNQCTRKMAQALLRRGYRQPVPKKGGGVRLKRRSISWIQKNVKQAQGGLILRLLVMGDAAKPTSWNIRLPARPFLGVKDTEINGIASITNKKIVDEMLKQ